MNVHQLNFINMIGFNKLTLVFISLCLIQIIFTHNKERVTDSDSNKNLLEILHRVKRKGIGSFFGAKSKTTPNTWDNQNNYNNYRQYPPALYGFSGSSQYNPDNVLFHDNNNYREANLCYLIASVLSFGVIAYCCYQCQSRNRNLDEEYRFRELRLRTNENDHNQQSSDTISNAFAKASAPPPSPFELPVVDGNNFVPTNDLHKKPIYPKHPPPSYEQVVHQDYLKPQISLD